MNVKPTLLMLCYYFLKTPLLFDFKGRYLRGGLVQSRVCWIVFAPEAMDSKSLADLPDWKMKNSHRFSI